jgi:hypothetical protein
MADPKVTDAFEKFIHCEKALSKLLQMRPTEDENMLVEIHG